MSGDKQIPSAIEGAFVVLLGQNAILFSLPIKNIAEGNEITGTHAVICIIAIITFFNVAANWVSSIEIDHDPVDYKSSHLFWDIAILGILFSKTQTLIQLCGTKFTISLKNALIVNSIFYVVLCLIYIVWNNIEINERKKRTQSESENKIPVLETANVANTLTTIIGTFMVVLPFFIDNNNVLYWAFVLWTSVWLYVMYIFITGNTLFQSSSS